VGLLLGFAFLAIGLAAYLLYPPSESSEVAAARAQIERRHFADALRLLDAHLDQEPSDLPARILAAQTARRSEDYRQAQHHLQMFERSSGPPLALELEQRLLAVQTGDSAQAALIHEFCQSNPAAPETPLALEALIIGDLRKLNRPLETPEPLSLDHPPPQLERLLSTTELWLRTQSAPADQVQGLVWRAIARRLAGDHPAAVADLQHALELDPNHFDARAYLALSIAQDQPLESVSHFEILRKQRPGDVRLLYAIATASRSVGELQRAQELLDEVLRLQPRNAQVLLERARLALDQRDLDAAKSFLERAQAAGPDSAPLHLAFARYMTMIGDSAAAKKHHDQFLKFDAQRLQDKPRQP
jgi:tetratricopeptide (TPR) repeat protein